MAEAIRRVGAVVLAAGQSRRMGQPKLVLPWGGTTVIGQVVRTLLQAEADEIVVVTGGASEQVQDAVQQALQPPETEFLVRFVENVHYEQLEMLTSLQLGLNAVNPNIDAILVALGDQPFVQMDVVRGIIQIYRETGKPLIVPSYNMRRGHPWLVDRSLWDTLLSMGEDLTMRDFLHMHEDKIHYVNVNTPDVMKDLDTPDDYQQYRP